MKRKKILTICIVIALLMAAAFAGYKTYARYQSKGVGATDVTVAKWAVKVNGDSITSPGDTEFTNPTITWTGNEGLVGSGLIAPGMTGTANVRIDPTGSQVAMNYYISIDTTALSNANIKINGISINENPLTMVALGSCDNGTSTTETECTASSANWTPSNDPHAGSYTGTIDLNATGTMEASDAIEAAVTVEWDDLNTDAANEIDTATGVAADGLAQSIVLAVVVEQKVGA